MPLKWAMMDASLAVLLGQHDVFPKHRALTWGQPVQAANAGGVAVSGLEMAQNSMRLQWDREECDAKLKVMHAAPTHNGACHTQVPAQKSLGEKDTSMSWEMLSSAS